MLGELVIQAIVTGGIMGSVLAGAILWYFGVPVVINVYTNEIVGGLFALLNGFLSINGILMFSETFSEGLMELVGGSMIAFGTLSFFAGLLVLTLRVMFAVQGPPYSPARG